MLTKSLPRLHAKPKTLILYSSALLSASSFPSNDIATSQPIPSTSALHFLHLAQTLYAAGTQAIEPLTATGEDGDLT